MKMNRRRLCAGLLAAILSLSGCSGTNGGGNAGPVKPVNVTETHYVTDTLHKVTVTETDRPFVVDATSEYKIIAGQDEQTQKAAFYLASYVEKATGYM